MPRKIPKMRLTVSIDKRQAIWLEVEAARQQIKMSKLFRQILDNSIPAGFSIEHPFAIDTETVTVVG